MIKDVLKPVQVLKTSLFVIALELVSKELNHFGEIADLFR